MRGGDFPRPQRAPVEMERAPCQEQQGNHGDHRRQGASGSRARGHDASLAGSHLWNEHFSPRAYRSQDHLSPSRAPTPKIQGSRGAKHRSILRTVRQPRPSTASGRPTTRANPRNLCVVRCPRLRYARSTYKDRAYARACFPTVVWGTRLAEQSSRTSTCEAFGLRAPQPEVRRLTYGTRRRSLPTEPSKQCERRGTIPVVTVASSFPGASVARIERPTDLSICSWRNRALCAGGFNLPLSRGCHP